MPHTPFTLDRETSERLRAVNGTPLELRDPEGQVVGYYMPASLSAGLIFDSKLIRNTPWTDEEIAELTRRPRDPSARTYTMAEVLKLVEGD